VPSLAQDPSFNGPPRHSPFWYLDSQASATQAFREAQALTAQQAYREKQFLERVNRVALVWAKMAKDYNEKHALNVKLVHEVSQAFHELERGEGWIKPPKSVVTGTSTRCDQQ